MKIIADMSVRDIDKLFGILDGFAGHFQEMSKKIPGNIPEMSRKLPRNVPEIS